MSLRKCVLIADDSPVIRRTLRTIFETAGWEVCGEAANGHDAIAIATRVEPHLVVLDLAMPEMNGLTASRILKQTLPAVKVILFTMYGSLLRADELPEISAIVSKAEPVQGLLKTAEELVAA